MKDLQQLLFLWQAIPRKKPKFYPRLLVSETFFYIWLTWLYVECFSFSYSSHSKLHDSEWKALKRWKNLQRYGSEKFSQDTCIIPWRKFQLVCWFERSLWLLITIHDLWLNLDQHAKSGKHCKHYPLSLSLCFSYGGKIKKATPSKGQISSDCVLLACS